METIAIWEKIRLLVWNILETQIVTSCQIQSKSMPAICRIYNVSATLSLTVSRRYSHLSLNKYSFLVSVSLLFYINLHSCCFYVLVSCCSWSCLLYMLFFLIHLTFGNIKLSVKHIESRWDITESHIDSFGKTVFIYATSFKVGHIYMCIRSAFAIASFED